MKIIRLIIFTFITINILSCNEMDNDPGNSYSGKQFWTSTEKAQYMLNTAYDQLYDAGDMWSDERLSDNLFQGRTYTDERVIRNGNAESTTKLFDTTWKKIYEGIKTCNLFLDSIYKLKADDYIKNRMIAQANYIRAALFFRATNLYGDVPFFTHSISLADSKKIKRTPHSCVMDSIHEELDDIITDLPSKELLKESERGQITKGAVVALQARAYLYDSDWANVEKYCAMLMFEPDKYGKYKLLEKYANLFSQDYEYNDEVIMDCGYAPYKRTWGDMIDMAPLSAGARDNASAPTQSLVDNYLMLDGQSIETSPLYDANDPYENRDPRLTATVIYDGYKWSSNVNDGTMGKIIYTNPNAQDKTDAYSGHNKNQTSTGYYVRKYYDPKHEAYLNSAINIITMRYADVLLMYAEAMNEQGKMSKDVWDLTIRAIRERAGFTMESALEYPDTFTQEQMRQVLRCERRSELALEGLRWYDIKRWNAGTTYLKGYVHGAKFENKCTENIILDEYKFDEKRDYLWSIPQSQMDIDPNLKPNNNGYNN